MKTFNRYYNLHVVETGYTSGTYKERYDRVGNWQTIKYTLGGLPYLVHNGKRLHLNTFYRFGSAWCPGEPFEIEDQAGRKAVMHGYEMEEYYKPLFVQLSDDGEKARLFRYEGGEKI